MKGNLLMGLSKPSESATTKIKPLAKLVAPLAWTNDSFSRQHTSNVCSEKL